MPILNIRIDKNTEETIQQQLVNAIMHAISHHELEEGEPLPSVNTLNRELAISRDTVFKAYRELKRRSIADSTPAKGYYVSRQMNRILLLLDYFSIFKDSFHQSLVKNLPDGCYIDLMFHHYNLELFESIILNGIGKYNVFIVMNPDTSTFKIENALKKLDPSRLLLIDIPVKEWNGLDESKYSYICQNFNEAVSSCLLELTADIKKYKSFHLIYSDRLKHPSETVEAFKKYSKSNNIIHSVLFSTENKVKKGEAYFLLTQDDLANVLKQAKEKKLKPGIDIGILQYNDSPLYDFIGQGITVISTDFEEMGRRAASFVSERISKKEYIQTKIIKRNSL